MVELVFCGKIITPTMHPYPPFLVIYSNMNLEICRGVGTIAAETHADSYPTVKPWHRMYIQSICEGTNTYPRYYPRFLCGMGLIAT
jgi:hypothetical protein